MKKLYFKLIRGYGVEDFISIGSEELEKAFYAFLTKKDAVYSGGAIKGSEIVAIQPDYHKTMGWNRGIKFDSYDYQDLRREGIEDSMLLKIRSTKEKVIYLMENKKENLIGQNIEIPELNAPRQV